jgi:micrococcal nuclease
VLRIDVTVTCDMMQIRVSSKCLALLATMSLCASCGDSPGRDTEHGPPPAATPRIQSRKPAQSDLRCTVTRIVDGDSFECGSAGRVRLVGIDAPELNQRPYGNQSRDILATLMPMGSEVRLEFDVRPKDPYGRGLAYVWDDSVLINEVMVLRGWALSERFPPNTRMQDRLNVAQQRAKDRKAGLWGSGGFDCKPADRRRKNC